MKKVYIYWDNSNIFYEVQRLAEEQNSTLGVRDRVRINFDNLLCLAQADREMGRLIAAGSVPPEMKQLWKRMENKGVEVELFDRIVERNGGRETPDRFLQLRMLENGIDNIDTPGIVVLLTGDGDSDGAEYSQGYGFHSTLELLHKRGWQVEVLSWVHDCNRRMRKWAEENGTFIALDDFYDSITFLESSRPGHKLASTLDSAPLDLSKRAMI